MTVFEKYDQSFAVMNSKGKPYHGTVEFIRERETGKCFAIASIANSDEDIRSKVQLSSVDSTIDIGGSQHTFDELAGKLIVVIADAPDRTEELPLSRNSKLADALSQARRILNQMNIDQP